MRAVLDSLPQQLQRDYAAHGEPFDSPLMVSLSNHERLAQDVLVEP